jgi:hypothetical protein
MVYVTAIHLEGGKTHEHIAEVQWRDSSTNEVKQSSRSQIVTWINGGGDARVNDGRGDVQVGVVNAKPPYIRTHADGRWTDNLLALPKY